MPHRNENDLSIQNYGSAQDVLGSAAVDAKADAAAVVVYVDDAVAYDPSLVQAIQKSLHQRRSNLFEGRTIEVRRAPVLTPVAPQRPQRAGSQVRQSPMKRLALLVFALAITCAAIWASWGMLARTLPLDPELLLRLAAEKLAVGPH